MNTQKIKFTETSGNKEIEVQGCYPFLESQQTGKIVLVVSANEADAQESDLHALVNNTSGLVEYYTREIIIDEHTGEETAGEWELKEVYSGYNSGEIRTAYKNGIYEARVTRLGEYEKQVNQNTADIAYIAAMADIPM